MNARHNSNFTRCDQISLTLLSSRIGYQNLESLKYFVDACLLKCGLGAYPSVSLLYCKAVLQDRLSSSASLIRYSLSFNTARLPFFAAYKMSFSDQKRICLLHFSHPHYSFLALMRPPQTPSHFGRHWKSRAAPPNHFLYIGSTDNECDR